MTDILTGKEIVQRVFSYVDSISKESRKALTTQPEIQGDEIQYDYRITPPEYA